MKMSKRDSTVREVKQYFKYDSQVRLNSLHFGDRRKDRAKQWD